MVGSHSRGRRPTAAAAGEVAFIIISSDFDVDNEARRRLCANMYRAVGGDGSIVSSSTDAFRLVDDTGFVLGGVNPELMDLPGNCCNSTDCCVSPSTFNECTDCTDCRGC